MAQTYYQRDTASDLSGGGLFSLQLTTGTGTANTWTINMGKGATETSDFFTAADVPSTQGSTGNYTVTANVVTGATSANVSVQLHRVSSAGSILQSGSISAEQSITAGIKTFSFTALNLGTWATGNRLRVQFRWINLASHQTDSCVIGLNTADEYVATPWTLLGPKPFAQAILV